VAEHSREDDGRTRLGRLDARLDSVHIGLSETGQIQRIGDYQVVGILGRGGMAVVYDARGQDGRPYAVKTIEKRWLEAPGSNAMRRFMHEVSTLERLEHPNVVRLHGHGIAAHPLGYELAFLVMERLDGKSLGEILRTRGRMPMDEVLSIASQMISALMHLDQHAIVHRDLKPGNVMIRRDGTAVLMDFGLARAEDHTRLTKTNHVVGTPQYMSPERIYGEEFDIRSDVFALGIILYEMMTGERAPDDRSERKIHWPDDLPASPETPALVDLVEAMLAPEPNARPSPTELLQWVADIRTASGDEEFQTVQALPLSHSESTPPMTAPSSAASNAASNAPSSQPAKQTTPSLGSQDTLRLSGGTLLLVPRLAEAVRRRLPPPEDHAGRRILWIGFAVAALFALPMSFWGGVWLKRHFTQPIPLVEQFTDPQAAFRFGDQALKDGRYQVAIVSLVRAVELDDQFALAHRRLADAYLSNGLIEEAKRHYRRYLELEPDAADAEGIRAIFK
jgi:serine/threonine-protein kinase